MNRLAIAVLALAGMLLCMAGAGAQTKAPASAEEAARQRFIKEQFASLKKKMLEVADVLEKTEPQSAQALREAVSEAQRAFIEDDMEKVVRLLSEARAMAAAKTESEVIAELKKVLDTLQHGKLEMDERLKRIDGWEQALQKIKELSEKQRDLERTSALSRDAQKIDQQMTDLSQRLDSIAKEHKELMEQTAKAAPDSALAGLSALRDELRKAIAEQQALGKAVLPDAPIEAMPAAAKAQEKLAATAAALAQKIEQAGKDPAVAKALGEAKSCESAAANCKSAGEEMKIAAAALAKSDAQNAQPAQGQAAHELKEALKAIEESLDKAAAATPMGQLGAKQGQLQEQTAKLAQDVAKAAADAGMAAKAPNLSKAAGHMGKAAGKMSSQDKPGAASEQKSAMDELSGKKEELAELHRKMMERAKEPNERQSQEQKDLADRAGKTAEQMAASSGAASQPASPGADSVASASKSMGKAGSSLDKGQSGQANKEQNDALSDLAKAQKELEDAIAREREMAQAEALAKIEDMLGRILKTQQGISAGTRDVHGKRNASGGYERPEELRVAELSGGEGRLAEDTLRVVALLKKEATTAVFPEVLAEVLADLKGAQKLLAEKKTGELTQAVQTGIEKSLEDMIDALRKEARKPKKGPESGGGGGGGGGGGQKPPLVPPVAELKMLKTLQLQVNKRTAAVAAQVADGSLGKPDADREHKTLGDRQQKVETMTKNLMSKLVPPQEPAE
jgi:hypothetical protein